MSEPLILVLDEGTTSTRAMLLTPAGELRGTAQRELTQHYPRPGWVEHDAGEIWDRTLACAREMVELAGGAERIACIGVTNQRETVVAWDKVSGEPLARALVRSQATTVSRWLVTPIAAIPSAPPASATISRAQANVRRQISPASCSTQPGRG